MTDPRRVQPEADLDDELVTWLREAHDTLDLQSDLRPAGPAGPEMNRSAGP
jgi:hypothetical protein